MCAIACDWRPGRGRHSSTGVPLFTALSRTRVIADRSQGHGATLPAELDRHLQRSRFPLPPLDEQRRIAAILDQADALRAKRRQALAHLDDLTAVDLPSTCSATRSSERHGNWPSLRRGELSQSATAPFGSSVKISD